MDFLFALFEFTVAFFVDIVAGLFTELTFGVFGLDA
jgi:hypothetical protein